MGWAMSRFALGAALVAIFSLSLSACGGKNKTVHEGDHAEASTDDHSAEPHEDVHEAEAKGAHEKDSGHGDAGNHGDEKRGSDQHGAAAKHGSAEKHGSKKKAAAGKHGGSQGHGGSKHGSVISVIGPDAAGLVEVELGEFSIT